MHTSILKLVYKHNEIQHVLANYLGVCCEYTLISVYLCAAVGPLLFTYQVSSGLALLSMFF